MIVELCYTYFVFMKQAALSQIKRHALPVLQHADVKRAALFGSYVRGEQTETSDIDILVDLPRGKTLLDLIRLKNDLEKALGKKVDVVEYEGIDPLIKDSIFKYMYPVL